MQPRQTFPSQWLIIPEGTDSIRAARKLPPRSGILLLGPSRAGELRQLRQISRRLGLVVVHERSGSAARVHGTSELMRAMLRQTPMILLSPIFETPSHPQWKPLPRMRAAALARLGRRQLLALGGMDSRKFARIERLGFRGWAGISAFRT